MLESLLVQVIFSVREHTERPGWSVIFCPVCRELRPAAAERTRRDLVFLLGLYSRQWKARTDLTCPTCHATFQRTWEHPCHDPGWDVLTAGETPDPLDLLEDADEAYIAQLNDRLDLEDRRLQRRLHPGERELLLAEPFIQLEHLGTDSGQMHIPTLTGFAIIGLVFAVPVTLFILFAPGWIAQLIAVVFCLLLVGLIVLDLRYLKNWRRSESVYKLLARALAPLEPTDDELHRTLAALRAKRSTTAGRLHLATLRRELKLLTPSILARDPRGFAHA